MRIVTIGMSPFTLTSYGRLNSWVMRYLYIKGHSVTSLVWGHDTSYFVPEEDEPPQYYYDFELVGQKHKIPISPFDRRQDVSVFVYEALKRLQPDLVVTVGEITDFLFMKAVCTFYTEELRWLSVLMNYQYPVHEDNLEILDYMDGILCTSPTCYNSLSGLFKKEHIDVSYVGSNHRVFYLQDREALRKSRGLDGKFRIMANAKSSQSDNLVTLMEAVAEARREVPNIELYVHSNIYDQGEYNLEVVRQRLDPSEEFIIFPTKYVSLNDGVPQEELCKELNASDLFVSIPMVSATSMTVFEALSCGCPPLLSDCGCNADVAGMLAQHFEGENKGDDFIVSCIPMMTVGETYLNICDPKELRKKVIRAAKKGEKHEGDRQFFSEFTRKYSQDVFLRKMLDLVETLKSSNQAICLETV